MRITRTIGHAPDYVIIFSTFFLVIFGLVMLASASSDLGQQKFGDSYYYLKHQLVYGLSFGIIGFIAASRIYYKNYGKLSAGLLGISIILLILIFTPFGVTSGGATRWLKFGPLVFQPAEILKITFIIYLASWLSGRIERRRDFLSGFLPFLFVGGLIGGLLVFQPSTSATVILLGTALIVYFASGARILYILSAILIGVIILAAISYATPYRWERIKSFLDPHSDVQSSSYQINQARIAIGSGGLWGRGFGQSTTKLHYLPQPIDDSIFAVIAEEFGFAGSLVIISAFICLIVRSFILANRVRDDFGKLILIGFGSLIAIQTFTHIGAISGLIPLTGMPLPFFSAGGTALVIFMTISGIMVNISKYT